MVDRLEFLLKREKKNKIEKSVKILLKEEEDFGIKNFKTYQDFAKKIYKIRKNVKKNISNLEKKNGKIIGYGSPAKATTALNFFNVSDEISCIIEDNKLKHGKFVPGVKIPIVSKNKLKNKKNTILVLAWNFFEEIKINNKNISNKFINIKDLEQ